MSLKGILRGHRWLAVLLVVVMLGAACDGDDDTAADAGSGDDTTTTEAAGDSDSDSDSEPPSGGDIVYAFNVQTATLDPVGTDTSPPVGGNAALAIYDSLMRATDTDEIVPSLAESVETEDAQTWTITLPSGVTFTDGTPLDAEAVVFNFERHMDPEIGAASKAAQYASLVESVTAVDDLTVEVVLTRPAANFQVGLSETLGYIASPTAIEEQGEEYGQNPVGAGPFMLEEWVQDDHMTLVANPDYYREGEPELDSITYRPFTDAQTKYNAVVSGEVDIAYFQVPGFLQQAEETGEVDETIFAGNGGSELLVNIHEAPFDDIRVRRALAHALDFEALNETVFAGTSEPRDSYFAPDSPFYTELADFPTYDVEAGSELIEEYESETGTEVTIEWLSTTNPAGAQGVQAAEVFQQLFGEIGVDVTLTQFDGAEWFQHLLEGNFDVMPSTYPHFADPAEMQAQLHTDGPRNFINYSNPEMDEVLVAGASTTDVEERAARYAEAQQILAEELPQIWFASGRVGLVYNPSIQGVDMTKDATLHTQTLAIG